MQQLKILTCGNVDDGKSTLIGHLLYDSKLLYVDQKQELELNKKIKKQDTIDYSLLLDGLDEEREQGITIDLAYRYFNTEKRSFIVIDAPGHEEYTRNMAVGASQANLALLLVDVTKGVLDQTRRHLKICMMMGIKDYIVIINKMDLVKYNKNSFNVVKEDIMNIFNKYKYRSLKIIPVSATKGDNITKRSTNIAWYTEEPLIEYLESIKIDSKTNKKFVLPIQRVCRPNQNFRGFQGNVVSGSIKVGDLVTCLPSREKAKVKELFNLDKKVNKITAGQAAMVTLDKNIDISRGCVLTNDSNIKVSNVVNVTMLWMDEEPLYLNRAYHVKVGTTETLCYIRKLCYEVNINNDKKCEKVNDVLKNEIVNCDLEFLESIPITEFKLCKEQGSLILINRLTNATSSCAIANKIINDRDLFYNNSTITVDDRKKSLCQEPLTIWFTGLSCSGKTTIANELDIILNKNGYNTTLLDGDNVRMGLNNNLTFSDNDRIENIRRIAEVSKLMNDAGLICITSFISPLNINRDMAKTIIGEDRFILIYINNSLEECEKRDKKGLYAKAKKGIIKNFTGIDSKFEKPKNPDLVLNNKDYKKCAQQIYDYIKERIKLCN